MDVWTEADAVRLPLSRSSAKAAPTTSARRCSARRSRRSGRCGRRASPIKAALTPANYVFEDRGAAAGRPRCRSRCKSRRKHVMLVDGSIFLNPDDGDLVRLEGELRRRRRSGCAGSRSSARISASPDSGCRPRSIQSPTSGIAGPSTFRMTYEYESVNGQHVGDPQPRTLDRPTTR